MLTIIMAICGVLSLIFSILTWLHTRGLKPSAAFKVAVDKLVTEGDALQTALALLGCVPVFDAVLDSQTPLPDDAPEVNETAQPEGIILIVGITALITWLIVRVKATPTGLRKRWLEHLLAKIDAVKAEAAKG